MRPCPVGKAATIAAGEAPPPRNGWRCLLPVCCPWSNRNPSPLRDKRAKPLKHLSSKLPILGWAPGYTRTDAQSDLVAAAIVTIMLVPQSLAYAMLAGLPPQVGLYASILPLIA